MTAYIEKLLDYFIVRKEHHRFRKEKQDPYILAEDFSKKGLSDLERAAARPRWVLEQETPVVFPDENIVMIRTVRTVPEIFTAAEFENIKKTRAVHELGKVSNVNPRYSLLLDTGTGAKRVEIGKNLAVLPEDAEEKRRFYRASLDILDSIEAFADKYRAAALKAGNNKAAEIFSRIPREKPSTFNEALQFLRLIHYCLWCCFNYHNTFGRFDQYMYPYYKRDIDAGRLGKESALELLEEFFISCNKDSDLYPGIQQGDNGQSMVLGGLNPDGSESYNGLSDLCLQASLELKLIDPKINLRVNKKTPVALYHKGSVLTKQGLGFPQYANDDIVIPALKRWGYEDKDAYNYVVAACWEFIVPGAAMDIVNINGLSFARTVINAFERSGEWDSFDRLMEIIREEIDEQAKAIMAATKNIYMEPSPLLSLMMDGCVEKGRDISRGGTYNNYGIHGTGLSTAVDSLAAIRKYVFEDGKLGKEELKEILRNNYEGRDEVYNMLRYEAPKMGNDDDEVDALAEKLLSWFADSLEGHKNDRGGVFRAGTGSAMYYIWHARGEDATPDGRKKGESLACNYSPSLFTRLAGPVSIIKSFAKPNLVRVANGGPLTIELHDAIFRNEESIAKVALFVKSFIDMGGHQMQINAVNRDRLKDAQIHPENHRNLIVRVWGWSGYFVELDEVYQNHIIERMELSL
ncbi:pyruvate formate-lyase [Spirochaetia bacterium]|nr:pyruvate formate-lyase [Spirochaetia bacterium]